MTRLPGGDGDPNSRIYCVKRLAGGKYGLRYWAGFGYPDAFFFKCKGVRYGSSNWNGITAW